MDKKKQLELLENNLNLIRTAKSLAIGVLAQETSRSQERDTNGKPKPIVLSENYYKAVSEIKGLADKEKQLISQIELYDPDLEFEADEELYYNENGELIIERSVRMESDEAE